MVRPDSPVCRALRADLDGLSYQARYLLAQVVCRFGNRPVDYTLTQLSASFGMSRASLVSARKELESARCWTDQGYLTRYQVVSAEPRRGPPPAGFLLSESFAAEIGLSASTFYSVSIQETAIRSILGSAAGPVLGVGRLGRKPAVTASKLSVSARLLLVTLWSFSDERGLVSGVGSGQLARLLNIQRARVRRHFKELEGHLYLECRLSGLTGRYVPGNIPGVAVLRTRHPDYGTCLPVRRQIRVSSVQLGYPRALFIYQLADEIERDRELAQSRGRTSGLWAGRALDIDEMVLSRLSEQDRPHASAQDKPFDLYKAFALEPQRWRVQNFLTFKLYEYAGHLINHCADRLVKPGVAMVEQVRDRIEQELCSNPALEKLLEEGGADALARWLYVSAHDVGYSVLMEVGRQLDRTSAQLAAEVGTQYGAFLILPDAKVGEVRVTFTEPAKPGDSHSLIVQGAGGTQAGIKPASAGVRRLTAR